MNHNGLTCKSIYVSMRDGIRLAVSTWLADTNKINTEKFPAILITTRYWRAVELREDNAEFQSSYPLASYLRSRGYILVVADVRGTGASFGSREIEISQMEVEDIGELINWAASQPWCDGRVATSGTSYTANTALCSLVTASPALQGAVCRAPDFDAYRHLVAPGGVANHWFIEAWGHHTSALDANDVEALLNTGWQPPGGDDNPVLGVRPVDTDTSGELLAAAVAEHQANFNLAGASEYLTFIDCHPSNKARPLFEPTYQRAIEKSQIPVMIRCGWHDAGTALGALALFASFQHPIRVMLGPWSHQGTFRADPFQAGDGATPEPIPLECDWSVTADGLDKIFQNEIADDDFLRIEYYTLGENRWKRTREWPLPQAKLRRFYLEASQRLSENSPTSEDGIDVYRVDPTAGTGLNNRWYTQMGNPIFFPDRREEDKKLLVYDTLPLEHDTEVTGHPIVHLWVRSTATDGQFFAYLETVDPDGRVRLLTEGQLRGLHRKISDEAPPYKMFGPYHSFKKKDAAPIVPGEVTIITFDLFPISALIKKGQRIRLAIAGADKDVFSSIPGCESPEITVERNSVYFSYIDLPIIS